MTDVIEKIRIIMGKSTAHIIIFSATCLNQLLEFWHDSLPAAVAGIVHAIPIMHFLPPVQTQNHVAHLTVGKVNHIIVYQHTVGRQGEAEVFSCRFFDRAGVGHQILHHLKVHQRFPAEKVHFQIMPASGVLYQKIQCLLSNLKAHHCPFTVIFTLACEAVGTVQVACMGNMQAECFNHACAFLFQLSGHWLKNIRCKELAIFPQGVDLSVAFLQFFSRNLRILLLHCIEKLSLGTLLKLPDHIVGEFVHGMHGSGANVQNDIVSPKLIAMNHNSVLSKSDVNRKKKCRPQAAFSFAKITCFPSRCLCFRTSDLQYRNLSCRQTGRKSGIPRIRLWQRSHKDSAFSG